MGSISFEVTRNLQALASSDKVAQLALVVHTTRCRGARRRKKEREETRQSV